MLLKLPVLRDQVLDGIVSPSSANVATMVIRHLLALALGGNPLESTAARSEALTPIIFCQLASILARKICSSQAAHGEEARIVLPRVRCVSSP